jgi:effector-binding domain-containing protein
MLKPLKHVVIASFIINFWLLDVSFAQQTVAPPAKVETAPLAPPASAPSLAPNTTAPSIPVPVIVLPPTPSAPIVPIIPQTITPSTPNAAQTITPPIIAPSPLPLVLPIQPPVVTPTPQTAPVITPEPAPESNILELNIEARPVLSFKNEASNEEGFATVRRDIAKLNEEAKKAGIVINGKPFAVIDLTDEQRFKFEVMLPIEKPASNIAPTGLSFSVSPSGQAIRFKFTGAYEESAYVYESIEAYMEEKNILARNYAIEEYLNEPKDGNDVELQMYIYYLRQ